MRRRVSENKGEASEWKVPLSSGEKRTAWASLMSGLSPGRGEGGRESSGKKETLPPGKEDCWRRF